MKILARALLLLAAIQAGCGVEEKDPGALNDSDLDRLRIDAVDAATVHVYSLSDVVSKKTHIHVENVTQGPAADGLAADDGSFDVTLPGAIDHVYTVQSNTDKLIPVIREETGAVVRGYGVSFSGPTGCWLQGWDGIIRESVGDPKTTCSLGASLTADGEMVRGPVEPFVLGRQTTVYVLAALTAINLDPPRFEIDFVNDLGEAFTVPIVAQNPSGQFGVTVMQLGQISPDLPGRTVESLELRAPTGSAMVLADITFMRVALPEE